MNTELVELVGAIYNSTDGVDVTYFLVICNEAQIRKDCHKEAVKNYLKDQSLSFSTVFDRTDPVSKWFKLGVFDALKTTKIDISDDHECTDCKCGKNHD